MHANNYQYSHIILTTAHHRFNDRYIRRQDDSVSQCGPYILTKMNNYQAVQLTTGELRDPLLL